jgi:peptidoglycan/xylan/chitin deacetylase (PgdA/CDA1 family)
MSLALTANRRPIPILVYHQIAEAPPKGAAFRGLYVSPAAFARQMGLLRLLGYQGLGMAGLEPYLRGEKDGKVVGITFDDGYVNNLEAALPVLQKHGFSSTCYAVSGLLGQTNAWDRKIGIAQVPLMDAGQLRQWVAGGQEIGSHTRSHLDLQAAGDEAARNDMAAGRSELEAATGAPVQHFCYPYGRYDARHAAMANELGFASSTTTARSRVQSGMALLELPRVPVLRSTSLPVLWLKLATAYEDRRFK